MAQSSRRKVSGVKKDIISELPQNLQEIIPMFSANTRRSENQCLVKSMEVPLDQDPTSDLWFGIDISQHDEEIYWKWWYKTEGV